MSDYQMGLDGILRDRITGKEGGYYMEILGIVQSRKKAERIINEIVSQGEGWRVKGMGEHCLIYERDKYGVNEELTAVKKSLRQWNIIKTVRQE